MITIIHGDDTVSSRNFFITQRQNAVEPITLNGASISLNDVTQAVVGQGLFDEGKYIFLEEFLSKRKMGKETGAIIACLLDNGKSNEIYLYESKDLTPKQLGNFKDATVRQFKITKTIFQFLDSIRPGNTEVMVRLFHKTLATDEAEFVFFMLVRQVRMLLALHDADAVEPIEEVKRMAPWQKSKLQKQAKLFTIESLEGLHGKLFSIDYALKTGRLPCPLTDSIDFLLFEI